MQQKKKSVDRPVKVDRDGYVRCRVCGCTEREPCNPPCAWVETGTRRATKAGISIDLDDLCTNCADAVNAMVEWFDCARRPSMAALMREVARIRKAGGAGV